MKCNIIFSAALAALTQIPLPTQAQPQQSVSGTNVSFHGDILANRDISAVSMLGDLLVIGADEAVGNKANENYIQLLKPDDSGNYHVVSNILVYRGDKQAGRELDIEGFAVQGRNLYVIGSHSLARKRPRKNNTYEENRVRMSKIKHEKSRYQLYRLKLDGSYQVGRREQINLSSIFNNDPVLSRFTSIPSKENGIDIEGIAVKDGNLYLGFRGPVLRDGYVPVMRLKFNNPAESYRLFFLDIEGRGIRDMAAVSDGFLILAGPVGNELVSYQLLHWNGKDCITGENLPEKGKLQLLTEITPPDGGKAEGLALISETAKTYELIMVFDGAKNGAPRHYTIKRPRLESAHN